MPIYDYVCTSCRHRIEVIHGIHDAGPRFCPACGEEATMRKALVSPAVHFKGSGWAKKDRSSSSRARAKSADDSAAGGPAGGDSPDSGSPGKDSSASASRDGGSRDSASAGKDATKKESGTASSTLSTSSPGTGD